MQFKLITILAITATATAQLSDLTQRVGDSIKSVVNSEVQGLIPSVTQSGIVGGILSSARASASNAAESRIGITASTTPSATAASASSTSTGAANLNQVGQIGVGAAVIAGFWGMAI